MSLALGLGGILVYVVWAEITDTPFDPVGFSALVLPPAAFVLGTWIFYRIKAPAQLFERQDEQLRRLQPQIPWVVAVEVAEHERRITVRLLLSDRFTGATTIDSATCFFAINQVRPTCLTPKSGEVSGTQAIEWQYPDEFTTPIWPLPDGRYEAVVSDIRSPSINGTASVGGQFQIGRPKRSWRRRGNA